eukprot:PITA_18588
MERCYERRVWAIMKNDVWDVVPRPRDKFVVTSKWLYKIKHDVDGSAENFIAKFVARGFSQKEGVDYDEVENDRPLILVLYMDDLFLTGAYPLIHQCKTELASEYDMKDLGLMHYFLGLEVWQKPSEIFVSQGKYVVKLLERFGMVDCKSMTTPMELNFKKLCGSAVGPNLGNPSEYRQLVGALMFLVNSCRTYVLQ